MPSIEYSGLKVSGGKAFAILTLLGALGSGAWAIFEFWKNYQDLQQKVLEYTAPDLSHFDEQLAVQKSEIDMILQEITIISDVARDMRSDMKADLRQMNGDIRHITEVVNDVEDRQKADNRELLDEMKLLEESLDLKIDKALNNPLSGMSAKSK
jgi:flagellar motility protein MotE (MotC chaperone)|tara:strand:- start:431 stop:892 length:462 start_codon:yes stop_codon:yes gene_type:complete